MVRLMAMAAWVPRVTAFVARVQDEVAVESLPAYLASITPAGEADARPTLTPEEMVRVIWNVLRWDRGRFNNGCFVRTFTRYHFLRQLGHPVVFHLGVEDRRGDAADATGLRSHAWLTLNGDPFLERDAGRFESYKVLYKYPATPAAKPPEALSFLQMAGPQHRRTP